MKQQIYLTTLIVIICLSFLLLKGELIMLQGPQDATKEKTTQPNKKQNNISFIKIDTMVKCLFTYLNILETSFWSWISEFTNCYT